MDRFKNAINNVYPRKHDKAVQSGPESASVPLPRPAVTRDTFGKPPTSPHNLDKPLPIPPRRMFEPDEFAPDSSRLFIPSISLRRSTGNRSGQSGKDIERHDYGGVPQPSLSSHTAMETQNRGTGNLLERARDVLRDWKSDGDKNTKPPYPPNDLIWKQYDDDMVDVLDTIDPEVQTLTSLTNMQNSLFIPNLGKYVNRRPTYFLSSLGKEVAQKVAQKVKSDSEDERTQEEVPPKLPTRPEPMRRGPTLATIDSRLSDSRYAVLPQGASLAGWSHEDRLELNDHVRHMLHSRRSKFKRSMKGFWQYVQRPLGFLVTLYATLITLFGLAWVLFLIGWINVGGKQIYVVHVIDSVLVALFAVVGDGLAPFRAVDTYHMIYIAHYHHLTWKIRKERQLPELQDHNDLPTELPPPRMRKIRQGRFATTMDKMGKRFRFKKIYPNEKDLEKQREYSVLNAVQQQKFNHHAGKFAKSHTFYKPHETETHYAFPLRLLVAVVVLLDCHSLLQISLGAVTWGIDYRVRPFALTTVILCCSITCNATAGLLIWIGDKKTRKHDVLERMNRQELTQEAIEKMQKKWEKDQEEEREMKEEKHSDMDNGRSMDKRQSLNSSKVTTTPMSKKKKSNILPLFDGT
ncbi:hypothetical protein M501DRAFT_995233 [Patellaria atrata CBS 101060]|uniref:Integral membrane protein n=1 Tax=Patellaria atrata CBS 101060 TaxID=1346257 RepID=A0A9P4VLW8_9PEZI|nr:hypothetical protein M501DRAFT_995233 [Patellaria atrata CBS 101060]